MVTLLVDCEAEFELSAIVLAIEFQCAVFPLSFLLWKLPGLRSPGHVARSSDLSHEWVQKAESKNNFTESGSVKRYRSLVRTGF